MRVCACARVSVCHSGSLSAAKNCQATLCLGVPLYHSAACDWPFQLFLGVEEAKGRVVAVKLNVF